MRHLPTVVPIIVGSARFYNSCIMRILSTLKSVVWTGGLSRVLHGPDPGTTQCDEPEQQHAPDQLAIDMMHPSVL
jgi:hypothetical protein